MKQYQDALRLIRTNGVYKKGPQKSGAYSLAGVQMRFDLSKGLFPMLTIRDLSGSWKAAVSELLWILSGSTDNRVLNEKYGIHFWDSWVDPAHKVHQEIGFNLERGELGPIYGHQMRKFGATRNTDGTFQDNGRDQLSIVVEGLRENPGYRRHLITLYNPRDFNAPDGSELVFISTCHGTLIHFLCYGDRLDMHHVQRSGDFPIGIPFNIAEYALLLLMVSKVTGYRPGEMVHTVSDAHIYENQTENVDELLTREPMPLCKVKIPDISDISIETVSQLKVQDFVLEEYTSHPAMKDIPVEV